MSELNLAIFRAKAARDSAPQQAKPANPVPVPIKDHSSEIEALTIKIEALEAELGRLRNYRIAALADKKIKYPRFSQIMAVVADKAKIEICELISHRRNNKFVRARHIAIYLCSKLTPASLSSIGRSFSDRDHATILHAVRKIARLCETDEALRTELDGLKVTILSAV